MFKIKLNISSLKASIVKPLPNAKDKSSHWLLVSAFLVFLLGNFNFKTPLYALLFAVYVVYALISYGSVFRLFIRARYIFPVYGILSLSYFWSFVPKLTLDAIESQLAFLIFVICVSSKHSADDFSKSLKISASFLVCFVVLYCVFFPMQSYSSSGLNAFFSHKNSLGGALALCALILFNNVDRTKSELFLGVVAFVLLVATQSKTAIFLFVVCLFIERAAIKFELVFFKKSTKLLVVDVFRSIMFYMALIFLVAMVVFRNDLLSIISINLPKTAFTGRGMLWLVVIQQMRENSLLGIGPGVFWQGGRNSEIAQTTLYLMDPYWVQRMASADGGYIDMVASIGFLGLALFLLSVLDLYRKLFRFWYKSESRLIFVLVSFVLLHAVTESTILHSTNVFWMTYLLCYFRVVGYSVFDKSFLNKKSCI